MKKNLPIIIIATLLIGGAIFIYNKKNVPSVDSGNVEQAKENLATIYISPEYKKCDTGKGIKDCLYITDDPEKQEWMYFFETIEGFTYEPGYEYEIVVDVRKISGDTLANIKVGYKLKQVVSKKKIK